MAEEERPNEVGYFKKQTFCAENLASLKEFEIDYDEQFIFHDLI